MAAPHKPLSLRASRLQIERYPRYDGHNRRAGAAAGKRALRARSLRRFWNRVLCTRTLERNSYYHFTAR